MVSTTSELTVTVAPRINKAVASIFASLWNGHVLDHVRLQNRNDRFLANIQRGDSYSVRATWPVCHSWRPSTWARWSYRRAVPKPEARSGVRPAKEPSGGGCAPAGLTVRLTGD